MTLDADETMAEVEAEIQRSNERAAKMPAFESEIAAVRGVANSAARDVFVEVDVNGRMMRLDIAEPAMTRGARRLAKEIMSLSEAAEAKAKAKALTAVTELLGENDPIVQQLRDDAPATDHNGRHAR